MEYAIAKIIGLHFPERQSCVLHGSTVRIERFPFRIQHNDLLWNEINNTPKFFSLLTELCLSVLDTLWLRFPGVCVRHYSDFPCAHFNDIPVGNERSRQLL